MTKGCPRAAGLAVMILFLSACAGALPPKPTDLQPIEPPQNMLGSTDDLGLVAFVADGSNGLLVVDFSQPDQPTVVAQAASQGFALEVVPFGSRP